MSESGQLSRLVRDYLERVVNQRDHGAVAELVSPGYHGSGYGWPTDIAALQSFYESQAESRPDWRIDVQQTIEVEDVVVVHAYAGGTVVRDERGAPLAVPLGRSVEWLAVYRFADGLITEVQVLALRTRE